MLLILLPTSADRNHSMKHTLLNARIVVINSRRLFHVSHDFLTCIGASASGISHMCDPAEDLMILALTPHQVQVQVPAR
jgi:hypothetical protein